MDQFKGMGTTGGGQLAQGSRRFLNLLLLSLVGLALSLVVRLLAPRLTVDPRFDPLLIFLAGAAAAVLVLRLMVQRERRVALQLVVSEIVGESSSPEIATMRILEALCVSQGWDAALRWEVNEERDRLEFCSAWGAPGRAAESMFQESAGLTLTDALDLPGRVWQYGRPVWISDLTSLSPSPRAEAARRHGMVSACAVPVRVGNKVVGVLEFYCHFCLRENREAMAAVETVASSLGQMLARSQERERSEKLYRQQQILLESVADGICGLDSQGRVSFANPAAARLLGASVPSLIGKPLHALLHGSSSSSPQCRDDCALLCAIGGPSATSGEDTIFRSDGTSLPVEYALSPIPDKERFSASVLSFRDISHRTALDRLKNEFISTVSHELRTPLTSIRGALGLLTLDIQSRTNDKAANLLRIAVANSERLMSLINEILDLERLQSGLEPVAFQPVQLAQIVRQAIDDMRPVADAAGVRITHEPSEVEIAGNPERLAQVLTNLLSNAIKFSPPDSTVSIVLCTAADGVTLSVTDGGRGIPADKLESIFGRFHQVDSSDSRQKGGTGLGLAICRTIVQQHAGRIWAERNAVRGSTFRVFLPYEPVLPNTPLRGSAKEANHGTMAAVYAD